MCHIIPFSAWSTIFIAIFMKGQHCSQILAPLKQEDMFNNNFGLGIKITAKYLALNAVFIIKFRYFASKLSPCMYKLQGCIRLYKFVNLALLFTQYENWIISYAKNIDKSWNYAITIIMHFLKNTPVSMKHSFNICMVYITMKYNLTFL